MSHSYTTTELDRAEAVPADARVRDYDELSDRSQRALFGPGCEPPADDVREGDVVRFTEYYRVQR